MAWIIIIQIRDEIFCHWILFFVDAGLNNHVTIKSEIRHFEKLISYNTGEFLWIMIHTNIILKQGLCRAEIEGNYVKTDSLLIITVRKSWIDDLVSFVCQIPDFGDKETEKNSIIKK